MSDYSCLMAMLPQQLAPTVCEELLSIPEEDLDEDEHWGCDPHVTVLYGIETDDVETVRGAVAEFGPVGAVLGTTSLFEQDDYDVLKIEVWDAPALEHMHYRLRDVLPCEVLYPEYHPHVTIAYLGKNGAHNRRYEGGTRWLGRVVHFQDFVFSRRDGTKTTLRV